MVGDSAMIIKTLVERGWLEDLNKGLGDVQRAGDVLIRALVEERIYFLGVRLSLLFVRCSEEGEVLDEGVGYKCEDEGGVAGVPSSIAYLENVRCWARVCECSC